MEKEVKEELLSNCLNYNNIFRLKGTKGLFNMVSGINKSGMCCVVEFLTMKKKVVKADNLISLSSYAFEKLDGSFIGIKEVFNNWELCEKKETKLFTKEHLSVLVPGYDNSKFKERHADLLINWWNLIYEKIKSNEKETEEKK